MCANRNYVLTEYVLNENDCIGFGLSGLENSSLCLKLMCIVVSTFFFLQA